MLTWGVGPCPRGRTAAPGSPSAWAPCPRRGPGPRTCSPQAVPASLHGHGSRVSKPCVQPAQRLLLQGWLPPGVSVALNEPQLFISFYVF